MSSTREASLDWTSCRNGAFLCVLPEPLKAARSRTPLAIWPWRGRAGGSGCCRKLKEPNMAKLTDTQLIVLSKAAARNDGTAIIPEGLNKAAATKVGASLVSRKLMREVPSKPDMPVWREDEEGRGTSLVITREGRQAIGLENGENDSSNLSSAAEETDVQRRQRPFQKRLNRIDEPRPGSKQAVIVTMLSRKSGATLEALVDAHRLAASHHTRGADRASQTRLHGAFGTAGRQAIVISHRL